MLFPLLISSTGTAAPYPAEENQPPKGGRNGPHLRRAYARLRAPKALAITPFPTETGPPSGCANLHCLVRCSNHGLRPYPGVAPPAFGGSPCRFFKKLVGQPERWQVADLSTGGRQCRGAVGIRTYPQGHPHHKGVDGFVVHGGRVFDYCCSPFITVTLCHSF